MASSNATTSTQTGHTGHWTTTVNSSGMIELETAGKYVDRNIDIVVPSANVSVSGAASGVVNASVGNKQDGKYPIQGTNSLDGTATVTVNTKGFTDNNSYSGAISGQVSASGTMNAASVKVSGSASVVPSTATKHTDTNVSVGTISTTKPSSGYYLAATSTTSNTSISQSTSGSTTGYLGSIANEVSASGTVTGGSTTTYFPITSANTGTSASGTKVSTVTPGASAKNVSISAGYTPARYWQVGAVTLDIAKGITGNAAIGTSATDPGTSYTENTSAVVPSGGYLKIDAGYIPATKISLATLVPQGAADNPAAAEYIRLGYLAYDSDGRLVTGTMPDGSIVQGGNNPSQTLSSGGIYTIKKGYYANDIIVKAQDAGSTSPAELAASGTASSTIVSLSFGKSGSQYAVTGSEDITGTATATVTSAGYASGDLTGTGSISGTANVGARISAVGLGASGTASATKTGIALVPSGSYGSYTFSQSATISGTATASVTSSGYGTPGSETGSGSITGTATISGTIASGTISGALHADSTKASGYDVYRINGNTAGWLPASQTSGNTCVNIPVYQGTYTVV